MKTSSLIFATLFSSASASRIQHIEDAASLGSDLVDEDGKKRTTITALHYNLGWESMSAIDFGSGKIASKHCVPGYVNTAKSLGQPGYWTAHSASMQATLKKMPFKRSADEKAAVRKGNVMDNYMSSCSHTMLQELKKWQGSKGKYDLATFVELCSPGKNSALTKSWGGGFGESSEDDNGYNSRQCGLQVFETLKDIFTEHDFLINNQPGNFGPVQQLSAFKSSVFGKLSYAVKTAFTPGRPLTALLFSSSQTLVINAHSIHFRKTLISPQKSDAEISTGVFADLISYAVKNTGAKGPGGDAFSVAKLPTVKLQQLLGGFTALKIAEGLAAAGAPCKDAKTCDQYIRKNVKKIVLAGDMNDETGELTSLPMFGMTISMPANMRKRTCCSDRDSKWLSAYGSPADEYKIDNAYPTHAPANWQYMLESNKYQGNCTTADAKCIARIIKSVPTVLLKGKSTGAPTENKRVKSEYPFAADLILTSGQMWEFGFPAGYVQIMGNGTISDHDPIFAKLTI